MLDDTVCIVCGGGRGLGEATAKLMAAEGASVVVNDLGVDLSGEEASEQPAQETVNDIEDEGGEAVAHYGDVSDLEYAEELLSDTLDRYGAVHNVTNFAGILRDRMIFNMTPEEWDAVIEVHLRGHYALMRVASEHWRNRYKEEEYEKQRSFLGVSSAAAAGSAGQPNYSAAKAGILGLMRSSAHALHRYNIRCNALWPGALTRMTESIPEEYRGAMSEEDYGAHLVAPLPAFLASDAAEDITGITAGLSGGELTFINNPRPVRWMQKDPLESGGWSIEEIAERWGELTSGLDTNQTER